MVDQIQGMNVGWCVDRFADENGATADRARSHKLAATRRRGASAETVALEAPAGTMVVMEGRLWHQTGNNRTRDEKRGAIFGFYTLPIYRTQENWFLSLNPSVPRYASETLLRATRPTAWAS